MKPGGVSFTYLYYSTDLCCRKKMYFFIFTTVVRKNIGCSVSNLVEGRDGKTPTTTPSKTGGYMRSNGGVLGVPNPKGLKKFHNMV